MANGPRGPSGRPALLPVEMENNDAVEAVLNRPLNTEDKIARGTPQTPKIVTRRSVQVKDTFSDRINFDKSSSRGNGA